MEHDPRSELEEEADERREERGGADADTAGDAAAEGLIGPDQPGGPVPGPRVGEGGPPSPPGPAAADPGLPPQARDPSLVTPSHPRGPDRRAGHAGAIPASDLPPAERARLAHEADSPQERRIGADPRLPERDRPVLRPRRDREEEGDAGDA